MSSDFTAASTKRVIRREAVEAAKPQSRRAWVIPRLVGQRPRPAAGPSAPSPSAAGPALEPVAPPVERGDPEATARAEAAEAALAEAIEQHSAALAAKDAELEALRTHHTDELARVRSVTRRVCSTVRAAAAELSVARVEASFAMEPRVAELAMEVATRAVGEVVRNREHDVVSLVGRLLDEARRRFPEQELEMRIHPADAPSLADLPGFDQIRIVADDTLRMGEVLVDASDGKVWDGVYTRLEMLSKAILRGEPRGTTAKTNLAVEDRHAA
jgi:flagellar biosynthesis/type III secretory pathway protein FliH